MTRELNKQWRNDTRQSFRKPSPRRYGEERSSHTNRPRLSREVVDRGWEQGAQNHHPDYKPRNGNSSLYQNKRQGSSPQQNRPQANRYNNNYRDNSRRFEHESSDNQGAHPRSFTSGRRDYNRDQNFRRDSGFQRTPGNTGARRGYASHESGSHNAAPDHYGNRRPQNGYQRQRPQGRPEYQERRQPPRNTPNTRGNSYNASRFEGDYEQFNNHSDRFVDDYKPARQPRYRDQGPARRRPIAQEGERHVTELPDGRVLKGSRPAQRRGARFWTGVNEDADELLQHIQEPEQNAAPRQSEELTQKTRQKPGRKKAVEPKKPRTRLAADDATTKKAKTRTRTSGPTKPSKSGFKWPTA